MRKKHDTFAEPIFLTISKGFARISVRGRNILGSRPRGGPETERPGPQRIFSEEKCKMQDFKKLEIPRVKFSRVWTKNQIVGKILRTFKMNIQ